MTETVIEAKGVRKSYGKKTVLSGIDFSISRGQIVGLIGPNGAGKTTLLKAMLGLIPAQGDIKVLGKNPYRQRDALMQEICFIADVAVLPKWLRVSNAIDFVEGVHPRFRRDKAMLFLNKTDIPLDCKIRELSKGMIAQLHLALVMAIDARILVLDEPTLGLDILYRKAFYRGLLDEYYTEERTIVVTTHQVEEVEDILTDVMIIHHGKLTMTSSMDDITARFIEVRAHPDNVNACDALKPLYRHKQLAHTQFIFQDVDRKTLAKLGDIRTPKLSDLFVAIVEGGAQ
jgi:ABC-2 type transport system ATP-binding protein